MSYQFQQFLHLTKSNVSHKIWDFLDIFFINQKLYMNCVCTRRKSHEKFMIYLGCVSDVLSWCDERIFLRSSRCCCLPMIYWRKSHQGEQENLKRKKDFLIHLSFSVVTEKTILFHFFSKQWERWRDFLLHQQEIPRRDRKFFVLSFEKFFVKNRLIFNFIFIFIRLRIPQQCWSTCSVSKSQ